MSTEVVEEFLGPTKKIREDLGNSEELFNCLKLDFR
jgi:hypothetical protein